MSRLIPVSLLLAFCGACAPLGKIRQQATAGVTRVSHLAVASVDSIRPTRVKIVEPRPKDLRLLPSGRELAAAYESERKQGFWIFNESSLYKDAALPEIPGEMSLGLLPPTNP